MPVLEGLDALAGPYISNKIAANYFYRDPLLYLMAALGGNDTKPTGLEIGRPAAMPILAGKKLDKVTRMALSGISAYFPGFAIQNPTNVKIMGATDTSPQVSAASSQTVNQGNLRGTAEIRWTGVIKEQILIWRTTLDNAVQEAGSAGRGIARAQVLKEASDIAIQNVYQKISDEIWTGSPTDQDQKPWDHFLGLSGWMSATNYWGRVNRSLAKNAQWRGITDATTTLVNLSRLIDIAKYDNYLADLTNQDGDGAFVFLCNNACYKSFKEEALGKGGVEVLNGLPEMAQFGVKQEVLRKDNVYIVRAKQCPAKTAYFLYLPVWKFIPNSVVPFTVTPFEYLPRYGQAAADAYQAYVEMQAMLTCDNPGLNMAFTNLTDPT